MPLHCVVRSCPTTRLRGTATETSLHQFPKDPILRDKWINFVRPGHKNWTPFTSSAICSLHFKTEESDGVLMKKFGYRTRIFLKPGAIPTIHPPPCHDRLDNDDEEEEEVDTSSKKKTLKKSDSKNTDKLIRSSLIPLADSDVRLLKDRKGNFSPSLPRFKNLVSRKKSRSLKAVKLLERSTASISSRKKKVKVSKKPLSLPIDVHSGEVHTNQLPKQAQLFPPKHFVGGNGPTRDHPDPLPVRPMNMLPSMVGYAEAGPSNQAYSGKPENSRRKKIATATISSETVLIPDDSPPQPTAPKLQKKQIDERRYDERRFDDQRFVERRFENRRFEERRQMAAAQSAQVAPPSLQHPSQMQQHLQVSAPPPPQAPPPQRQVQVLAPPVQVPVAKPKPVEKPRPREKRIFVVADHQRCVMSNLSSLWKSGKLCDAGIGNGSSTVMVHKVVLSAVCPKLLSVFSTDILSHKFLQVNFPEEVSTEALNAFAEYMYNGILDLDRDILEQLKIIAKRLDMKEFEQLCDSHLPTHMHQPSAAVSSFTHIPLIQTSMPIPDMTSSLVSPITTSIQSDPSITTQVIDVKQEITDAELAQVQKDTAAVFGQESAVLSLAPNKSGSAAGFVICPSIKTEPVGPDDNRYGRLSSSSTNQVFTSTTSSSQPTATSISSVPASSTEYSIPFSQSTDVKSTRLKAPHSYETPLVSDLSPVSRIVQTVCSQPTAIKEDSTKTTTRQSIPTSSIELPLTSANNSGIYPVGLFTAAGANLPLLTTETVDVKTIDLYKTDLT